MPSVIQAHVSTAEGVQGSERVMCALVHSQVQMTMYNTNSYLYQTPVRPAERSPASAPLGLSCTLCVLPRYSPPKACMIRVPATQTRNLTRFCQTRPPLPRPLKRNLAVQVVNRKMAEASLSCSYTDLKQGVDKLLQLPGPHYVVFLADNSPATGVSWCPDCVRCGPAVKRVCADQGASLLEVLVGQREVWKDPQHPLRNDPAIKLGGVPDLMRWGAEGPTAKLGVALEKAGSPAEAVAVVAKFLLDTKC